MSAPRLNKLVFAHDHQFVCVGAETYCRGGQFSDALWGRYLEYCSQIEIVAREQPLRQEEDLARLERISGPAVTLSVAPSQSSLSSRLWARREARQTLRGALQDADVLLARLPSQLGLLAIDVAESLGKPWAVECVGCTLDAHRNHGSLKARAFAPIAYRQMQQAILRAPTVMYVTERFLQSRYPTKGAAFSCSDVELDDYGAHALKARLARIDAAGGEGRPLRFGMIAALDHCYKGVDVALLALRQAEAALPPWELQVVGAGDPEPWRHLAQQLKLPAVQLLGPLPTGKAVRDFLDQVDVYLQPSRQEGLPRALIEAMGRACPALGSSAGGIGELLADDCLHTAGDSRQLARALQRCVASSWQREQAKRNHREAARFLPSTLEPLRDEFWAHLRRLVGDGGTSRW